jgi:hypothetical protein
VGLCVGGN